MNRPPEALCEQLPAHPSSVGRARRLLRAGTAGDDLPEELVEAAELLVSELVCNAVVHAGTPIEIRVSVPDTTSLYVAVSDGNPHHPRPQYHADTAGTGRGLRLLTAMSEDWGVSTGEIGKTVWFRVSTAGQGDRSGKPPEQAPRDEVPAPVDTVAVQLRKVPLATHAAWQETAAALLREYLLARMDETNTDEELERHSRCSEAMSLLAESVPAPSGAADASHADVTLRVPVESVAHFATLDETLDRAVLLADTDQLLTGPTDPRTRAFRRWVCHEVRAQAKAAPPTPWRGTAP